MYERTDSADWNEAQTERDEIEAWLYRGQLVTIEELMAAEQVAAEQIEWAA